LAHAEAFEAERLRLDVVSRPVRKRKGAPKKDMVRR